MNNENKSYKKILAENIRARRNELNISQEQLADKCGFHKNYINRLETAKTDPSFSDLKNLSSLLEISLSDLVEGL